MWHLIWIIVKWLLALVAIAIPYYLLIRTAILGRGFFRPDMQRVDDHYGLYKSWNSVAGYLGYYLLFFLLIIFPIGIAAIFWLS